MEGLQLLHRQSLQTVILGNRTGALHPTQEDLRGTRIGDSALTQATFNLLVTRGLAVSTRGVSAGGGRGRGCGRRGA
jgi:hypothetical protein